MSHRGFALIDVISPCVTFNNTRPPPRVMSLFGNAEATGTVDFVPMREEITTSSRPGAAYEVTMHDGSVLRLYEDAGISIPLDRRSAMMAMMNHQHDGTILTGLIYLNKNSRDLHDVLQTSHRPLNQLEEGESARGTRCWSISTRACARTRTPERCHFIVIISSSNRATSKPDGTMSNE